MTDANPAPIEFVRGDATGLVVPAHAEALRKAGEAFLTRAFRAFGSLGRDNGVVRIRAMEHCPGGSTGSKLFLTVDYETPDPRLHCELFVKFSRDFSDERRDLQRREMESEARFAATSRQPGFPISVPTAYFADYHHDSGTGILITQRIRFGEGGIEAHRRKCLDHLTCDDPFPYYRAMVTALARLAAAHKTGQLHEDIDAHFPFDPTTGSADPISFDREGLKARLSQCASFAAQCPRLLPAELRSPEFIARMERDALRIFEHQDRLRTYLAGDSNLIALCHWNAHIDNCWFWRDEAGLLQCGLIDWGRAGQISFGAALWGALSAAHHDIWDHRLDELLGLFASEYHRNGRPMISEEALSLHLALHVATMAVARCLVFPEVILFRLPEAIDASGPLDPMFDGVDAARNSLHIYTVLLKYWHRRDFGAALDQLLLA